MRYLIIVFFAFVFSLTAQAQRRGNPALADEATLQEQFDTMLLVSNRYREGSQRFRVVRRDYLDAFIANVNDSIVDYTARIGELEGEVDDLDERNETATEEVEERDATIAELENERDTVSLLGIELAKGTYSLIMWALVIGLLIALLVAMASTRVAATNNNELRNERDKLAAELEQSRKSRLTVEQELRRQLQDEINKRNG